MKITNDMVALPLMRRCEEQEVDIYRYGTDLPEMARTELKRNIWAARFLYWRIFHQGLCLRPPWSMVEHIGYGADATNTQSEGWFTNPPFKSCPSIPEQWPESFEDLECSLLHQSVCGKRPSKFAGLLSPFRNRLAYLRGLPKY